MELVPTCPRCVVSVLTLKAEALFCSRIPQYGTLLVQDARCSSSRMRACIKDAGAPMLSKGLAASQARVVVHPHTSWSSLLKWALFTAAGPHQQQQQQYGPPPNLGGYAPPPQQSYPRQTERGPRHFLAWVPQLGRPAPAWGSGRARCGRRSSAETLQRIQGGEAGEAPHSSQQGALQTTPVLTSKESRCTILKQFWSQVLHDAQVDKHAGRVAYKGAKRVRRMRPVFPTCRLQPDCSRRPTMLPRLMCSSLSRSLWASIY